jgi:hypothetical protein
VNSSAAAPVIGPPPARFPCGKRGYHNALDAAKAACELIERDAREGRQFAPMAVFFCSRCDAWHTGHDPQPARGCVVRVVGRIDAR